MVVGLCISGLLPRGGSKGPYLVEVPCIKKKKKKEKKRKENGPLIPLKDSSIPFSPIKGY